MNIISLFSHVGHFHDPRICQLCLVAREQSKNIRLLLIHLGWIWKFGWVRVSFHVGHSLMVEFAFLLESYGWPAYMETNSHTTDTVHMSPYSFWWYLQEHCSSRYHSLEILFIGALSLKIMTLFIIFLLFILVQIHYLHPSQFLLIF
jgi:hypothetical protein